MSRGLLLQGAEALGATRAGALLRTAGGGPAIQSPTGRRGISTRRRIPNFGRSSAGNRLEAEYSRRAATVLASAGQHIRLPPRGLGQDLAARSVLKRFDCILITVCHPLGSLHLRVC